MGRRTRSRMRAAGLGLALWLLPALAGGLVPAAPWGAAGATAQTWFDALLARVDGQAILASDVTLEEVLFGSGRSFADLEPAERQAVIERLIRRRLLLKEAGRFGVAEPTEAAVTAAVAGLADRLGARLAGLDPDTVRSKVRARLWADAFVEARIRAFVFIRDAQVTEALARLPAPSTAAEAAALEARVRAELAAREAEQRLSRYLARLEGRATIRRYPLPDS